MGPTQSLISVLLHGEYEIRNKEGNTTRVTGSHIKMYKLPSDACCVGDEDRSSSQGGCVVKFYLSIIKLIMKCTFLLLMHFPLLSMQVFLRMP